MLWYEGCIRDLLRYLCVVLRKETEAIDAVCRQTCLLQALSPILSHLFALSTSRRARNAAYLKIHFNSRERIGYIKGPRVMNVVVVNGSMAGSIQLLHPRVTSACSTRRGVCTHVDIGS